MSRVNRILAVYAHPDDEAFVASGTFANLTDTGGVVALICATRGEVGEIREPELATVDTLGAVRERELRTAMSHVGVSDIRFLGFRDSGMKGTEENNDPRAFINAEPGGVVDSITRAIRQFEPDVVITFGPDGVYGHPDHIMAYRMATAAVEQIGPGGPTLYYSAIARSRIVEMARRSTGPFSEMTAEEIDALGTPDEMITTVIDVNRQYERKLAALRSHSTQIAPDGPLQDFEPEKVREMMAWERFVIADLPWQSNAGDPLRTLSPVPAPAG